MAGREDRPKGDWQRCRVLVTGSTGLLGSRLAAALASRGAEVVGFAPSATPAAPRDGERAVRHVVGRVEDAAAVERVLAEHRPRFVFHLAACNRAEAREDPSAAMFETNVRGTWTLLEACQRQEGIDGILVASSAAVYGGTTRPALETDALNARGPYDTSKACADAVARAFAAARGLPVAVVRSARLYGPGDSDWTRLIPGAIRSVWRGERPELRSDGSPRAEYLHVDDAVAGWLALAAAMADPSVRGSFNLGTGIPFSVLEVVRELLEVMASEHLEPVVRESQARETQDATLDSSRARAAFGWEPRRSLRQGLIETVRWVTHTLAASDTRGEGERTSAASA